MTRSGLPRPDAVLLRLRLIGHMEALTLGNESVLPLGRKTRGLLAILALGGRKPVLRLRLAQLLWSRRSEEQARASLRQEIHRLLEALSPLGTDVITVERHTLALKPALTSVDAERILTARPGQAESLPPIEGVLLEELNGTDPALDGWLAAERARLRDHAVTLFEAVLARQRDPEGTIAAARQLLALDGRHEPAWLATIQAQQALGNVALARQTGERCLAALEAGRVAAPGPELRDVLHALDRDQRADILAFGAMPPVGEANEAGVTGREETAHGRAETAGPERPGGPETGTQPGNGQVDASRSAATGAQAGTPGAAAGSTAGGAPPGPDPVGSSGPVIVVMPVMLLDPGGETGTANFASGLAQALEAVLVGNSWTRIPSNSALQETLLHGRDDAALRRRFGARYVLDGTLQRIGEDVRVILRLSDIGRNGQMLWAQRFDGKADALMLLQDRVASQAAARLPMEIVMAEAQQWRRLPENAFDPLKLAAFALRRLHDADRAEAEQTMLALMRGLERAPGDPHLHMVLSTAHLLAALQRWGDPGEQADRAESSARMALADNPSNSQCLVACANILAVLRNRPDAAMALVERALSFAPHTAEAWAVGACALIGLGRLDEAERFFATYKTLFATHPFQALLDLPEVMLPLLRGDNEAAARMGLMHTELRPAYVPILVPYLAALGHLRQTGEAERIRTRLLQSWPDSSVDALVRRAGLGDPAQAERLRTGLLLAGLGNGAANDGDVSHAEGPAAAPAASRRSRRPLGAAPLAG